MTPGQFGVHHETLSIATEDGEQLCAWAISPAAEGPAKARLKPDATQSHGKVLLIPWDVLFSFFALCHATNKEPYTERIKQAQEFGDMGLVIRLEDILAEETDHAEELERLGR